MDEIATNSIGDRITYCRSSLALTRKELSSLWGGASVPTIARWELDTVKIPNKKLLSIIKFFLQEGLIVNDLWVVGGVGNPPFLINEDAFSKIDFDSLAQENLLNINMQQKNFVFGQARNTLASPFIKYGDYIGGIANSLTGDSVVIFNSLVNELVFVKTCLGLFAGILKSCTESVKIESLSGAMELISFCDLESIGKVQWIVRRP
jgi:hypothetical protein